MGQQRDRRIATADESSDCAPAALPMKLKVGTTFFGKSEIRPPNKNFYFDQTFLVKRGWLLRWGGGRAYFIVWPPDCTDRAGSVPNILSAAIRHLTSLSYFC